MDHPQWKRLTLQKAMGARH